MKPLFRWLKHIISNDGPKSPVTRHVCHALSTFMDNDSCTAFPSIKTLSDATKLSERTIKAHIKKAVEEGWIIKSIKGVNGQGWRQNQYLAAIPKNVVQELPHVPSERGASGAERGAYDCKNVVQELHTNSIYNSSEKPRITRKQSDALHGLAASINQINQSKKEADNGKKFRSDNSENLGRCGGRQVKTGKYDSLGTTVAV